MRLDLGEHVRTKDGQDVGTIDQLILDPASGDIKSAVVHKGIFLPRDVQIPVEVFDREIDDAIQITYSADQVDQLPPFYESDYTRVPPSDYAMPAGYAMENLYWPTGAFGLAPAAPVAIPPTPMAGADVGQDVDIAPSQKDIENAVVGKDSVVQSRDGGIVGYVHDLVFDPQSQHLVSIVVRKGLIFTKDRTLSASEIDRVDDGIVYLNASTQDLADDT